MDTLAKTRSRMTTAVTFSRQNDAGSRASSTYHWENLLLVVDLVSESKGLYFTYATTLTLRAHEKNLNGIPGKGPVVIS